MNISEFSSGFDTQLNSYMLAAGYGEDATRATVNLDEYTKSLLLTQAQEDIVLELYGSFEEKEEIRRYLSALVKDITLSPDTESTSTGINSNSKFFVLPDDLWFITYESVTANGGKCGDGQSMEVLPVTQDEYNKLRKNPFRGANDRRALRLDLSDSTIEIVCKYNVASYYLRYLRRPNPIVLIDLPDGLSINGEDMETECELHEALHQRILDRAVALALQNSKNYRTNNNNA